MDIKQVRKKHLKTHYKVIFCNSKYNSNIEKYMNTYFIKKKTG